MNNTHAKNINTWKSLHTLGQYLWGYRLRIAIAMVFLILAKIATIAVPITMKELVDWFDTTVNPSPVVAIPIFLLFTYGLLGFFRIIFEEFRNVIFARASQRVVRNVGVKVFRHLHQLSHAFHQNRETGAVSRDIERGTRGVNYILFFLAFSIIPTLFEITVVCVYLAVEFKWYFATITIFTVVVYSIFTLVITNWRTQFRVRMNEAESRANTSSVDALLNYETVKYFGNLEFEVQRYDRDLILWEKESIKSETSLAFLNLGQGLFISIGIIWLLFLAADGIITGEMTLGDFIMLNAFLLQMYIPLNFLGTTFREINHALTDMDRMFNLLSIEDKIPQSENAPPLQITVPEVEFRNVSFGYSQRRQILKNISFQVPSGQKVAIVGPSGAGKSTIVRLLFRFYDVTDGSILIDNQDIREVNLDSLQAAIGVVPQDTVLFNNTLEYNICYGRADCSSDERDEAVAKSQLATFIQNLPDGYNTVVGERGLKLSGGEKQRVSIARTLLKDPPILILDEATSSLDTKSESRIQDALETVAANRTTLVIAHRLSTIADADLILVLQDGQIVEQGTHFKLLEQQSLYAEMWHLQRKEKEKESMEKL